MINCQLSKQDIRWPVSPDRSAGSSVDPSRSSTFLKLSADKLPVSNDRRLKFIFSNDSNEICCVYCHYGPALLRFWFQTDLGRENSTGFYIYMQGRQSLFTFLTVTRWSRSASNFYVLIGQNLTGEFMRKIYAASWILFTLTAEAERVLCQLVMFLTVFFHWMHKMTFSCYQESSVIHG